MISKSQKDLIISSGIEDFSESYISDLEKKENYVIVKK